MGFFTLLDTSRTVPTPTPNALSPEQTQALNELFKGLFSEQMTKAVSDAPANNFLIYAFLIIAVVLIISVIVILKIATSSMAKSVANSLTPYTAQFTALQESFENLQVTIVGMTARFGTLTDELIRFQTIRVGEEDRVGVLLQQFQELQNRTTEHFNNLFSAFREHEKGCYDRQLDMQKHNMGIKLALTEMKANCGVPYKQQLGERLVSKGYITRVQLEEVLREQALEETP